MTVFVMENCGGETYLYIQKNKDEHFIDLVKVGDEMKIFSARCERSIQRKVIPVQYFFCTLNKKNSSKARAGMILTKQ